MGSFFSSKSSSKSSGDPVAMEAFNVAKPALQYAVGNAMNLANQYNANPAYSGPRVAALNPFQSNSANFLGGFSSSFAPSAAQGTANVGFANLGAGSGVGANAQDIFGRASMDPTGMFLSQAGLYADNPYTQGMIDAASRDVTRNLFENQLPGLDRAASGTGNLNSTRAGVESAIAQRGAADRLADISSGIRSQFFGKGLDMAQNQFNQNLQNMIAANQNLQNAGQFGMTALNNAGSFANQGFAQGQAAGNVFQGQEQANLDAAKAFFDESLANRLAVQGSLLGAGQGGMGYKGGPTSSTSTSSPSMASIIGSLFGAFK